MLMRLEFVEAAEESIKLGVDISDQLTNIGQLSKDDLEAKKEFTNSQNKLVEKGVLSRDDARSRAQNAKQNSR